MKRLYTGLLIAGLAVVLVACGGGTEHTADDVIKAFEDAGLTVEAPAEMTKDDYGMAPMKADEGVRFEIPELGEDKGGRILTYSDEGDLADMKAYYDDLGAESAMFFSWTAQQGNVLLQINGDLPEDEYNAYVDALESME